VTTPLGKDVLLLETYSGREGISQPFLYRLEMLAEDPSKVVFDKLLGKVATVTVELPGNKKRYLSGLINQFSQGNMVQSARKDTTFVRYRADIVPEFWLLTQKVQSRIFQQLSVPDILKKVMDGLKVNWKLQKKYEPRDYCVQYRESDFAFASRLMEEEGIFYFFEHTSSAHEMIVADSSQAHESMPGAFKVNFEESGEYRVYQWEKVQEVRAGKYVLRDHCFEMPDKDLQTTSMTLQTVKAGTISHNLKVGGNDKMEIYDYPGGYANHYDGIAPGGAEQNDKLSKIFDESKEVSKVRMEQETVRAVQIFGESDCRNFTTGFKFTLDRHYDANGSYVLTSLEATANLIGAYTTGGKVALDFANKFECIPLELPYRPQRTTTKPLVHGTQTAVVVGPSGQEIFTDKYSRVKVQFFWDRDGKKDANSSCWIRVGTAWAGKQWGMVHIPRIGQEVIVAFLEGDPDQPIIVGSVFNSDLMPPYKLPDNMTRSLLKTRSSAKGTEDNFNELRFEDKKDNEEIYFHAERDFNRVVENNDTLKVGSDKAKDGSQTIEIWKNRTTNIKKGDDSLTVEEGNRKTDIKKDDSLVVQANRKTEVKQDDSLTITGKETISITGDTSIEVKTGNYTLKVTAGKIHIEAPAQGIELVCGANSVKIETAGITLQGTNITIQGSTGVTITSPNIAIG
jgi:type VI secretion system secreted protein VgrG